MEYTQNNNLPAKSVGIEIIKQHQDANEVKSVIRYCTKNMATIKPEQLYNSTASIRKISKSDKLANPETTCKAIIFRLINRLNIAAFGNVEEKYMAQDQVMELINIIFSDYADLNINELAYIEKKIKKGDYGTLYGNFSIAYICRAFDAYRAERAVYMAKAAKEEYQRKLDAISQTDGRNGLLQFKKKLVVELSEHLEKETDPKLRNELEIKIAQAKRIITLIEKK